MDYRDRKDGLGIAKRFTWHAQSGAAQLGFIGDDASCLSFWLDRIRRDAPEQYIESTYSDLDGEDQVYSIEILDICGLSAEYCHKCQADETKSRIAAQMPAINDRKREPELNVAQIKTWMDVEGWTNETLAQKLNISERAVSSIRNNGNYHGSDAVTKLANLMGCDVSELYLS